MVFDLSRRQNVHGTRFEGLPRQPILAVVAEQRGIGGEFGCVRVGDIRDRSQKESQVGRLRETGEL